MGDLVAISTCIVVGTKEVFKCAAMPVSSASVKGIIDLWRSRLRVNAWVLG